MIRRLTLLASILYTITAPAMWQCIAIDKSGRFYVAKTPYIKITVYKALDVCKTNSNDPASCVVERASCNLIVKSDVNKTYWNCFSFDNEGEKYPSGPYGNKYQAGNSADSLCRRLSSSPTTCNVPPYACEKI